MRVDRNVIYWSRRPLKRLMGRQRWGVDNLLRWSLMWPLTLWLCRQPSQCPMKKPGCRARVVVAGVAEKQLRSRIEKERTQKSIAAKTPLRGVSSPAYERRDEQWLNTESSLWHWPLQEFSKEIKMISIFIRNVFWSFIPSSGALGPPLYNLFKNSLDKIWGDIFYYTAN